MPSSPSRLSSTVLRSSMPTGSALQWSRCTQRARDWLERAAPCRLPRESAWRFGGALAVKATKLLCLLALLGLSACKGSCFSGPRDCYDERTGQQPVLTHDAIDQALDTFESVTFESLPVEYTRYSRSGGEFASALANRTYRVVRGHDIFRYVVADVRVDRVLAKDRYYERNVASLDDDMPQYWLIDKRLLYKILDLKNALTEAGYDDSAIWIRDVHRHPLANQQRGGASKSRHIRGEAVDIVVRDVNRDRFENEVDKRIVLELLETEIIGDEGGIGRYPGTMVVHFDVRGYRARWDRR